MGKFTRAGARPGVLLLLVGALLTAGTAVAVDVLFMTMSTVNGPGSSRGVANEWDVKSVSFGLSMPVTSSGLPTRAGFQDVTIVKAVDTGSPVLAHRMASGTVIPTVVLTVASTNVSGGPTAYYGITLTNVRITSIKQAAVVDGDTLTETVTLYFEAIRYQSPPGCSGKSCGNSTWNTITNAP